MKILKTPLAVNCIPFLGPCVSVIKVLAEDYKPFLQVASVLREDCFRKPTEETVQRLKNVLNGQIYGMIGSVATIVSLIAMAALGMIVVPEAVILGIFYAGIGAFLYCFHEATRHDCAEILKV